MLTQTVRSVQYLKHVHYIWIPRVFSMNSNSTLNLNRYYNYNSSLDSIQKSQGCKPVAQQPLKERVLWYIKQEHLLAVSIHPSKKRNYSLCFFRSASDTVWTAGPNFTKFCSDHAKFKRYILCSVRAYNAPGGPILSSGNASTWTASLTLDTKGMP